MADDDVQEEGEDQTDLVPRSHIRQLEEQAKKSKELEAQLSQMQRENAFARALGSTDHPARSYFEKGYDGELDVETIRAAASAAGLINQPAPAPEQPDDLPAHARMASTASGAGQPAPFDLAEEIAKAKNSEEVMALIEQHGDKHGLISSRLAQ